MLDRDGGAILGLAGFCRAEVQAACRECVRRRPSRDGDPHDIVEGLLAWTALNRAAHFHPYELPPTREDLLVARYRSAAPGYDRTRLARLTAIGATLGIAVTHFGR